MLRKELNYNDTFPEYWLQKIHFITILFFQCYDNLLVSTWGHDPAVIQTSNVLLTLNDALAHSAVLLQAHSWLTNKDADTYSVPFPKPDDPSK